MRRFLYRLLIFFMALVMVDFLFGLIMEQVFPLAKSGEIRENNDICLNGQYDILIMGSSRARHHYIPSIFQEVSGQSCYNCGRNGCGAILMYGFHQMVTRRYTPGLIIYDLSRFDFHEIPADDHNMRYIAPLRPYSMYPEIQEVFQAVSPLERIKNNSSLFRYNTLTVDILKDFFGLDISPYNPDGFCGLQGVMDGAPGTPSDRSSEEDSIKIHFFKELLSSASRKGIPIVCVLSPKYNSNEQDSDFVYGPIKQICSDLEIPVLDYFHWPTISSCKKYFKDPNHMNESGAVVFSHVIVDTLISLDYLKPLNK